MQVFWNHCLTNTTTALDWEWGKKKPYKRLLFIFFQTLQLFQRDMYLETYPLGVYKLF